jgi:hypothetical protein
MVIFFPIGSVLGVIFGLICGAMAASKNKNVFLWFVAGLFFGFIPLIILAMSSPEKSQEEKIAEALTTSNTTTTSSIYDVKRWKALVEFDPEIAAAANSVLPFGQKYVDQLAEKFLALNDKQYLSSIAGKIIILAQQDAAEADAASFLTLADEKIMFLGTTPIGPVAVLKDGQALLEQRGQISKFPDAASLRKATNDQSQWMPVEDRTAKLQLAKLFALHVPKMTG